MPDQSYLTSERWYPLLDAFKRLVWSLFNSPFSGKRYKFGMAIEFERQISYFAWWMVENDYTRFSEIDAEAISEYIDDLREEKFSDPTVQPTATNLLRYLILPLHIWNQSSELALGGVDPFPCHPYGGSSAFDTAKRLAPDERGQINPIDDDPFIEIVNAAVGVLADIDDIIASIDFLRADNSKHPDATERVRQSLRKKQIKHILTKHPRIDHYLRKPEYGILQRLISMARDSCSVIVQSCVGLRTTEFCGLVVHPVKNGLPACISVRKSISGLDEIFFLKGRVYKKQEGWVEHEWVAGIRPVGERHLPLPVKAVLALTELFREFRTPENESRLSLYSPSKFEWECASDFMVPTTTTVVRRYQQAFVTAYVGIADLTITPGQWRKTFAQFIVRTDSRMVPALREHFRHANLAMTESGYALADPEYKQALDDAAVQNSVAFLGAIVSGKKLADGPMADTVRSSMNAMRLRQGNRDETDLAHDLEDIVRETGIRVHPLRFGAAPTGDCIYRPGTGLCTKGCMARWVMPSPLWSAARPDICWECENVVFSGEHGTFWRERWQRHKAVHASAAASGDESLACLARTRMAQCASVLSRLGITPQEV